MWSLYFLLKCLWCHSCQCISTLILYTFSAVTQFLVFLWFFKKFRFALLKRVQELIIDWKGNRGREAGIPFTTAHFSRGSTLVGWVCWWRDMTLEKVKLETHLVESDGEKCHQHLDRKCQGRVGRALLWLFPWLRFSIWMLSINNISFRIISHTPDFVELHPNWVRRPHFSKVFFSFWKRGRYLIPRGAEWYEKKNKMSLHQGKVNPGPFVCSVCPP